MSAEGDQVRWNNIRMAAQQVRCCEAGRVAYGHPCPWHGRSDPQYLLVNEDGTWFA